MTELPALEQALHAAARRRYGAHRRLRRAAVPVAAAVVAALVVIAVVRDDGGRTGDERPALPTTDGFARQLTLLGVLRDRLPRDNDPQVAAEIRAWRDHQPRRRYVRLLGKARSGYAFVLIPVRRYDVTIGSKPGEPPKTARDGLCLMRRGSQGGAGMCGSTEDLLAGRMWGALAGQVYGVVPDGVTAVRPLPGAPRVPVRRNFYVYDDPRERGPIPPPAWCRGPDRCVPSQRP